MNGRTKTSLSETYEAMARRCSGDTTQCEMKQWRYEAMATGSSGDTKPWRDTKRGDRWARPLRVSARARECGVNAEEAVLNGV